MGGDVSNALLADGEYLVEAKLESWQENVDQRSAKAEKK